MGKEKLDMTKEELEEFFNKYDLLELSSFELIFNNVYDYDIEDILISIRKVYDKKSRELSEEEYYIFESISRHIKKKCSCIKEKNNLLTEKELDLLYKLCDSALMCLTSTEYNEEEVIDLSTLVDSLEYESNNDVKKLSIS